jgi:hypothetical protein
MPRLSAVGISGLQAGEDVKVQAGNLMLRLCVVWASLKEDSRFWRQLRV